MYLPQHKAIRRKPLLTLLAYIRPHKKRYLKGAVLAVFFVGVGLAMPVVIRSVVNQFEAGEMTYKKLGAYFLFLLTIAMVSGIGRYFQRMLMIGASRTIEYELRNDFYRHVQSLGQDFFHRMKTGDIMARAVNDLSYVREFLGPGIMGSADMICLPFTMALMLHFSVRLTLVSSIPMPILSLLVYTFIRYIQRQSNIVQDRFSDVTARAQENLAGARVVRAYGLSRHQQRDFEKDARRYMRETYKLAIVTNMAWVTIGMVVGLGLVLVVWYGGRLVIADRLPLGNLMGVMVCLMMITWPLAQFGWVLTLYQRGAAGMRRMLDVFDEIPAIQDPDNPIALPEINGAISFEKVSFAYDANGPEVLHDLSFEIPAGKTVAIVGPTGSGKSTVAALIAREYDATQGIIRVDGVDIRQIPLAQLRGSIGASPQDIFLFSASIRDNLQLGRPDATDAELHDACRIAQFQETVDHLEQGLDTLLGERGINLSGGQKQRLAIARAIIRDPRILILDDSLSSVDTHTEERILEGLRQITATRTSLIIAHRVSSVAHADDILVLEDGHLAEHGTHAELLAQGGLYAAMYARQQLEQQLEEA